MAVDGHPYHALCKGGIALCVDAGLDYVIVHCYRISLRDGNRRIASSYAKRCLRYRNVR